jgi:hypothetical protein
LSDPIEKAFEDFIAELYWSESLEEAEEKLEDFMRNMDRDLREALLERRRRICSNASLVARAGGALKGIGALGLLPSNIPGELGVKARIVAAIVNALFLVQCAPRWQELDLKVKARILAPLYRAAYAMKLASRAGGDPNRLVEEALEMAALALDRISREGLLEEMEAMTGDTGAPGGREP